jgi:hypothetical protein
MSDLKLYARSPEQLQSMFALVKSFSDSICMEFGLDKCAVFHAKKGKVQDPENGFDIMGDTIIPDLGVEDNYKYLALKQLLGIADTTARKQVGKKVLSRIEKVCKSQLNARNKITAINSWAIPVAAYTFGGVRPDLVLFDKKAGTAIIVDIAIPLDDNLETIISEKKRKYLLLAVELKDIYKLKSTSIVPLVMPVMV